MFRALVLGDAHSNQLALEAVLKDAKNHGPYGLRLFTGDAVGYCSNPVEVLRTLIGEGFVSVLGNHDRAVLGGEYRMSFNADAAGSVRHNKRLLQSHIELKNYLKSLSNKPYVDPEGRFAMVHGSFNGVAKRIKESSKDVYEDIYVNGDVDAIYAMKSLFFGGFDFATATHIPIGIVGHTHVPLYTNMWTSFNGNGGDLRNFENERLEGIIQIEPGQQPPTPQGKDYQWLSKALINPGSVGQPRGKDPRAAYAILTINESGRVSVEYKRVEYDFRETQRRMAEIGFSEKSGGFTPKLIKRLELGI